LHESVGFEMNRQSEREAAQGEQIQRLCECRGGIALAPLAE